MSADTEYGYAGVERWLPDRADQPGYEVSLLHKAVAQLELSETVHLAAVDLLEAARDKQVVAHHDLEEVLAAAIYVAARDAHDPRTMEEIGDVVGVPKKRIGRVYRYLGRALDIRIIPPRPEDYLPRFAARLGLSETVQRTAAEFIDRGRAKSMFSGKSSTGIAAAALYLAASRHGEDRTMRDMADTLAVTTVTIRDRGREFVEQLSLEPDSSTLTDKR